MGLAVVTGGARGIGRAIVDALLARGVVDEVAILDLEPEPTSGAITSHACDVTDPASVADAATAIAVPPTVLVNNAGGGVVGGEIVNPFDPWGPVEGWRRLLDLNLTSAYVVTRQFGPAMGSGSAICNVASIAGLIPSPMYAYGAAKAGLLHWTRELAQGLAGSGVRVNAVAPGFVYTRQWEAVLPNKADFDRMAGGQVPMGTDQTPEDIAEAVAYLCSDRARQVTGQCIAIDGGSSNRPS